MIREGIRDMAGRDRREYSRSISEENPFKQPLLVKSRADSLDTARGFCNTPSKRSNSRREMALALAAERERDDAAEAMGQGMYSLHAVIGQGSFGRIHLASWRREDTEGLDGGPEAEIRGDGRFRDEAAAAPSSECGYREVSLSTVAAGIREALGAGGIGDVLGARTRGFWRRRRQRGFDSPGGLSTSCHGFPNTWEEEFEGAGDGVEVEGSGQPRLRALKSICKRKVTEKGLARHIQTELAVLRQCSHPFIVSLSPVGGGQFQTSGHLHLVLEYCPGGDLLSVLRREGRLMETQARVCAAQVALALRHLHDRHIAYRDLKPENICIDAKGRAILVDFSLARIGLDRAPDGKAMTFCGSAAYAAPEMIAREGHDTRVDLWSLGCVIYEVLVGEHPFRRPRDRSDRQALFDRIRRGRPNYPSYLSRWAVSLLKGLLTVDPDRRLDFSSSPLLEAASISTGDRRETKGGVETVVPSGWSPTEPLARTAVTPSGKDDSGKSVRLLSAGVIADADRGGGVDAKNEPDEERSSDRSSKGDPDGVSVVTRDGCDNKERSQSGELLSAGESVTANRAEFTGDGRRGTVGTNASPRVLSLLEHGFFRGMPGWGGPGTGGAWDETKLEGSAVVVPSLRNAFDVQHFDSRFTSQAVGLVLQGHPHKGGPTPPFEEFDWRPDGCIELAQVEDRRHSSFLGSVAAAFWC